MRAAHGRIVDHHRARPEEAESRVAPAHVGTDEVERVEKLRPLEEREQVLSLARVALLGGDRLVDAVQGLAVLSEDGTHLIMSTDHTHTRCMHSTRHTHDTVRRLPAS